MRPLRLVECRSTTQGMAIHTTVKGRMRGLCPKLRLVQQGIHPHPGPAHFSLAGAESDDDIKPEPYFGDFYGEIASDTMDARKSMQCRGIREDTLGNEVQEPPLKITCIRDDSGWPRFDRGVAVEISACATTGGDAAISACSNTVGSGESWTSASSSICAATGGVAGEMMLGGKSAMRCDAGEDGGEEANSNSSKKRRTGDNLLDQATAVVDQIQTRVWERNRGTMSEEQIAFVAAKRAETIARKSRLTELKATPTTDEGAAVTIDSAVHVKK